MHTCIHTCMNIYTHIIESRLHVKWGLVYFIVSTPLFTHKRHTPETNKPTHARAHVHIHKHTRTDTHTYPSHSYSHPHDTHTHIEIETEAGSEIDTTTDIHTLPACPDTSSSPSRRQARKLATKGAS